MSLERRIDRLEKITPPRRRAGVPIPTDPAELLAGLLAGRFTPADIDRTDYEQVNALGTVAAALAARAGRV